MCDDRDPSWPNVYVTEDDRRGALRKYTPSPTAAGAPANWNSLHGDGGKTEYLVFLSDKDFAWSECDSIARDSQSLSFPNLEGIDYDDGEQTEFAKNEKSSFFFSRLFYITHMVMINKGRSSKYSIHL